MQNKNSNKESNENDQYCSKCGAPLHPTKKEKYIKILFPIVLLILSLTPTAIFLYIFAGDISEVKEEEEGYGDVLELMSSTIEPVGYFSEPESYQFDSKKISRAEWIKKIVYTATSTKTQENQTEQFPEQNEILKTVVKIVCTNSDMSKSKQGSGTNFLNSGFVITNLHTIKSGDVFLESCMVGYPNPETGQIVEAYWASSIIDDEENLNLDLAILSIDDPVFDDELKVYGYYDKIVNKTFPTHAESGVCIDSKPILGEKIFILGYPSLTGGTLTITDGLVSSLRAEDGLIISSAKVSEGNSGGLAVSSKGCVLGVPSRIHGGGGEEQYAELIDSKSINKFSDFVADDIDEYFENGFYSLISEE